MFTPFKVIFMALQGKFRGNKQQADEFWLYLVLVFLGLFLTGISAYLGIARATVIFSGTNNPLLWGSVFAIAWAFFAFFLLSHVTSRLAFLQLGGKFHESVKTGFAITIILFLVFGGTDVMFNLEGIKPASRQLTRDSYTADTGPIDARYAAQIAEQQARIDAIDKEYTWDGKYWFGYHKKFHPNFAQDKVNRDAAVAKIQELENLRDREKTAELDKGAADMVRYGEEIELKTNGFTWLTYVMYLLMGMASYRAALFSLPILDYFEENSWGDIPGDQVDRYGPHKGTTVTSKAKAPAPSKRTSDTRLAELQDILKQIQQEKEKDLQDDDAFEDPEDDELAHTLNEARALLGNLRAREGQHNGQGMGKP